MREVPEQRCKERNRDVQRSLRSSVWLEYELGVKEMGQHSERRLRSMSECVCTRVAGEPG